MVYGLEMYVLVGWRLAVGIPYGVTSFGDLDLSE
jgi:hypothetical protein